MVSIVEMASWTATKLYIDCGGAITALNASQFLTWKANGTALVAEVRL